MSHIYPDPIQGPNSPLANTFSYQPMQHYPAAVVPQISLRDYFAAAALQGLMANPECNWDESDVAKFCYEMSNEMIKAREVKP